MLLLWLTMSAPACALYAAASANRTALVHAAAPMMWGVLFALAAGLAVLVVETPLQAASALLLMSMLTYLAVFDLRAMAIPVWPTLTFAAVGWVISLLAGHGLAHAISAFVGWAAFRYLDLVYRWRRGRSGLGSGDALIAALIGAWLSWEGLAWSIACAGIIGVFWAISRRERRNEALPFAPALALGVGVFLIADGLSQ